MDKIQKHNSFNTNTPSSVSYRNYLRESISAEILEGDFWGETIPYKKTPSTNHETERRKYKFN
jgi:hypothetical protein